MITLLPQPISEYERRAGLLYHVRRSDATPEPPAIRCVDCDVILLTKMKHARRCNKCASIHTSGNGFAKGALSAAFAILLCLLSVIITPVAHAQVGNIGSNSSPVVNRQGIPLPGVNIAVCQPTSVLSATVTSNLAVLTLSVNPIGGYFPGATIMVSGFTGADSFLNAGTIVSGQIVGGYPILSVTSSTVVVSINHANAITSTIGSILQQGNSRTACAGLAPIYQDPALTIPSTNPIQSDQLGNWNVFALSGTYYVQFYSPTTGSVIKIVVVGVGAPNLLPLANQWLNTNNFLNGDLTVGGLTVPNVQSSIVGECAIWIAPSSPQPTLGSVVCGSGGGGSGTVVASNQFQLFAQPNAGSSATAQGLAGITTDSTGNNLYLVGNGVFGGPNPWVDMTAPPYSTRSIVINTTGTGSGTSLTVSVASFANNDGITVAGSGNLPAIAAPAGLAAAPGFAGGMTVPDAVMINTATGSSSYTYCIFAIDIYDGATVCTAPVTTTTAAASLGNTSATISTWSLTGNTLTINTAAPNLFSTNTLVHLTGTSNNALGGGWYPISIINTTSQFVINNVPQFAATTVSGTGGKAVGMAGNNLTWTASTGGTVGTLNMPWEYFVCAQRPGDGSLHIIGRSLPSTFYAEANGGNFSTSFVDFGATITANPIIPWDISNANCTAGSPQREMFTTTVASGGTTAALGLANSMPSAASGALVRKDDAVQFSQATLAAHNAGAYAYVPTSANGFVINSPVAMQQATSILQAGGLTFNAPVLVQGSITWSGVAGVQPTPAFGFNGAPIIVCNAYPCIYEGGLANQATGGGTFDTLTLESVQNGLEMLVDANWGMIWNRINFVSGSNNNDNMGMALVIRPGAADYTISNSNFVGGPNQVIDQTWTPLFYETRSHTGCCSGAGGVGTTIMTNTMWNRRGFYDVNNGGDGMHFSATERVYSQGGITPRFTAQNINGNLDGQIEIDNVFHDTESQATYAWICNLSCSSGFGVPTHLSFVNQVSTDSSTIPNQVTGGGNQGILMVVASFAPGGTTITGSFGNVPTGYGWFYSGGRLVPSVGLTMGSAFGAFMDIQPNVPTPELSLENGAFLGNLTSPLTANRNWTMPDASGIVCLTTTCAPPLSGLTNGIIPQGSTSFPFIVNSSPQLDNGVTTANTLTYAGSGGITSPNLTDSALTPGDCVQASTAGLLVSAAGACATGGTVTNLGNIPLGESVVGSSGTVQITAIGGTIESSLVSGADICAKIATAATTLASSSSGGIITTFGFASGAQACAASPFGSWPANFNATIEIAPYLQIQSAAEWSLPSNVIIDGMSQHPLQAAAGTAMGATIQMSNSFPTNTPLIQIGSAGNNTDSIRNIRIVCQDPSAASISGSTGIQVTTGEEGTKIENVWIDGCDAFGLDVSTTAAQQGGWYHNISISMRGVNDASTECFRIGSSSALLIANSVFDQISCGGSSNAIEPTILATVDAASVTISGLHMEEGVTGLLIGSQHSAHAINILNSQCSSNTGMPMTTCFSISSANVSDGITFMGDYVLTGAFVTNLLVDSLTNGGTIPVSSENSIGSYSRGKSNTILSNSNVILSVLQQLSVSSLTPGDCVQAGTGGQLVSAAAACGSGGGSPGGATFSTQINSGGGGFTGVNSPIVNGTYTFCENIIASTGVAPTWCLPGVTVAAQTGGSPSITQANLTQLVQLTNNTTSTALSVPIGNSLSAAFTFAVCNTGTVVATATPTTSTVNGNTTQVLQGKVAGNNPECAFWWTDGTTNGNYWSGEILPTDANGRLQAAGMPHFTGDAQNNAGTLAMVVSAINGTSFVGANGDLVSFGAGNTPVDSTVVATNVVTQTAASAANQVCTYTGTAKVCTPSIVTAAMGGTGINTSSSTGVPSISGGTWSVNTTLPVTLGGWGLATLTSNDIYKGNGTSAPVISSLSDNGTVVATSEPVQSGASTCTTFGTAGGLCPAEGTNTTNVAGAQVWDANSTTHEIAVATNGSTSFGMLDRTQPGSIRSTGLVASVTTATLCAASAGACNQPGTYHISVAFYQSGAACTTNTTGGITPTLTWTDGNGTTHTTVGIAMQTQTSLIATSGTMLFNQTGSGIGTVNATGDFNIDTNGTIIQYAIGFAQCSVSGTATYAASLTATRLQ